MRGRAALLAAAAMAAACVGAQPVAAEEPRCNGGVCRVRLTPEQLLAAAEKLVAEKRYGQAREVLRALAQAPGFAIQTRFLAGYMAAGEGRWKEAADQYKAILADDPAQTRVRLELARAFLAMGQTGSADRQFAMAERAQDLSPEIARTIRTVRNTIRANRRWQLDVTAGIAPDTNINNATAADTVTVMLGDTPIPLELNKDAQRRSGLGLTARASGSVRLPIAQKIAAIADLDVSGTEYKGGDYDTYVAQVAGGAEYQLSQASRVSLQAVGAQRWFGGPAVSRQYGVRGGGQAVLDPKTRIGLQLDVRRTDALFNDAFSGWQYGAYGTVERSLTSTLLISAGPFVRRDSLAAEAFSSTEFGANLGVGGEAKWGVNFGASAGLSRAAFDAAMPFFSPDPRRDWNLFGRATLGNRKIRVWGLSPQISWSITRVSSSIDFYSTTRSRFEFTLARYF
jgi:outer membrane protein